MCWYGCSLDMLFVVAIANRSLLLISHDLQILAAEHAGQNVSALFWLHHCHTMPPQVSVAGGQV